jgi:hypothetical protein
MPTRIIARKSLVAISMIGDSIGIPPMAKSCAEKKEIGAIQSI